MGTGRLLPAVARVRLRFWPPTAAELEHVPVENVVVGEALAVEQVPEQLAQVAGGREGQQVDTATSVIIELIL